MTNKILKNFILHNYYSRTEIMDGIGSQIETDHKGQFIKYQKIVLCLLRVSTIQQLDHGHLRSPTRIEWETDQSSIPEGENLPRVPDTRLYNYHLFLAAETDSYYYCGTAHVGSYGRVRTQEGEYKVTVSFTVNSKLPRELWLTLGGYPAWRVHTQEENHFYSRNESAVFKELITSTFESDHAHVGLSRYEGDALLVIKNKRRCYVMYTRYDGDPGLYVDTERKPKGELENFPILDFEVDWSETLSFRQAIRLLIHYFEQGSLPTSFKWKELNLPISKS